MHLSKVKTTVILYTSLLLTSCATPYIEPIKGPTATMSFSKPDIFVTHTMSIYKDPYNCTQPQTISYSIDDKPLTPFKIKANDLFTFNIAYLYSFTLMYVTTTMQCDKTFSFYPKPNEYYFVEILTNEKTRTCNFIIYKLAKAKKNSKPSFVPIYDFFVRKNECKDKIAQQRNINNSINYNE